ncbi:ankyrin [Basidiobolus meristosporus CBS 931.73]|uniref:Ankyrin n=1 Tax=Basidiobolus meristosporus CBS 931.73 TaxID=1314790 RepID=A0A1Y1Y8I1_9FUNG|nr:ankyrin [Basidiobolus meristosporus CBS 931.73]|eukprot:ORX94046.1 ankyrin [Basidiobolus meristosporus CBS 931.73]
MSDEEGASNNELILAACKNDHLDMLEDVLNQPGTFNVNHADSLGNTGLHYAAKFGALSCVASLLQQPEIEVDKQNRISFDTPLHMAVTYKDDPSVTLEMVQLLIEHDADPRIPNKLRQKPVDIVDRGFPELRSLLQQAELGINMGQDDIVGDDSDSDSDGEISE